MSFNFLQELDDDFLSECCRNVKVLDLSNNEISILAITAFNKLTNLEILHLGSNKISNLNPGTFKTLTRLKQLELQNNPIKLQSTSSEGFLIQSNLEELNLDQCDIKEIPDGTFNNMTQLKKLTLAGNPIDENLDTSAFERLEELLHLTIANLSEAAVYVLCEKLVSVDVINFDGFAVSCTILSDESSFQDSLILNDSVEEPRSDSVTSPPVTTRRSIPVSTTITPILSFQSTTEVTTSGAVPQLNLTTDESFKNQTKIDTNSASVNVDNETIKFMLIGESIFTL